MILKEIVERTTKFFKEKKIESARLDSELLISSALGLRRIDLYLKFEQPLKESELEKCRDFVRRRGQGEPVAYILGQKDFYNLTFEVDQRVLIPRPETESLVELVLTWTKAKGKDKYQILDLGAGSGCIGLTLAKNQSQTQVTLIEASSGAIEVLTSNRDKLGLGENCQIVHTKAQEFKVSGQRWDVIVANPPYISKTDTMIQDTVKKFEPAGALFAEDNGLREIQEWSIHFAEHLKNPGLMIFEIGMSQGDFCQKHFESLAIFDQVTIQKDLAGLDRFVVGERL